MSTDHDYEYKCPMKRGLCDIHAWGSFEANEWKARQMVISMDLTCSHVTLQPEDIDAVVYHGGCPDGFTSALIARFALNDYIKKGKEIRFYPVLHADRDALIDKVAGQHVLFLDIAPSPALLQSLTQSYAVLDHHSTTEADLATVDSTMKAFRMDYAGCRLTWAYFYPQYFFPYLFRAIEARDLWTKDTIENCDALLSGLHTLCKWCPCCWWEAAHNPDAVQKLVQTGSLLNEDRMQRVQTFCKKAAPRYKDGIRVWVMNINDLSCVSDAGNQVLNFKKDRAQDVSLSFRYDVKKQKYMISLRSLDQGPDVGLLAQQWGQGGGHKHAAGFDWPEASIESLFDPEPEADSGPQKRKQVEEPGPKSVVKKRKQVEEEEPKSVVKKRKQVEEPGPKSVVKKRKQVEEEEYPCVVQ